MKNAYLIPIVIATGLIALFFFPEPEANIFAYAGTAFFFLASVIFLLIWNKEKR